MLRAAVLLAIVAVSGCAVPAPVALTMPAVTAVPAVQSSAVVALASLPIKGRAPKTGYSREQFGPAWADTDHNGCLQRDDVLARDLTGVQKRGRCIVTAGTLTDPYTGKQIVFVRGRGTSNAVQIDHVVALSNAWQTGAQQLTPAEREAFATDVRLNLLAVDGRTNQAKGDGDAATWLPPAKGFRCAYVSLQIAVKVRYRLWVTWAEHDAMARVLAGCPTP